MFKRERKNSQYLRTSVVRKGKFALFWRLSTRGEGGLMSKNQLRITARGLELLKGSCRGVLAEGEGRAASQLWKSSWNQECGGLASIILIVLSTVNLQLQGLFLFLRPVLRIVYMGQLMSWLQFGHHGVIFLHLLGTSVSAKQLIEHGWEY